MFDASLVVPVLSVIAATVVLILIIFRFDCLRIRSTVFGQKIELEASTKDRVKETKKLPRVIDGGPIEAKQIEDSQSVLPRITARTPRLD